MTDLSHNTPKLHQHAYRRNTLHALQRLRDNGYAVGDMRLYYAVDLLVSEFVGLSEPGIDNAVSRFQAARERKPRQH